MLNLEFTHVVIQELVKKLVKEDRFFYFSFLPFFIISVPVTCIYLLSVQYLSKVLRHQGFAILILIAQLRRYLFHN